MGLLDMATDPQSAMLTQLGLGLLSASGPSRMPVSMGQALGQAGQQGMQGFQQAQENQMRQAQIGEFKRKQLLVQQQAQYLENFIAQLPSEQQAAARLAPDEFIKNLPELQKSQLVKIADPNEPLREQSVWLKPGQTAGQGTVAGVGQMPESLDPRIQAAKVAVAQAGRSQAAPTPFYQFLPTDQGYAVGNARTGEMSLDRVNGGPVMRGTDSPELQGKIAGAKQVGEAEAKRDFTMSGVGGLINEAQNILDEGKATGSVVGRGIDLAAGVVGASPRGAAEADQLKVLAGYLVSKMPRMEGPQSNFDVQNYKEMAGDVGNSMLPLKRRKAALDTLRGIVSKYDKGTQHADIDNGGAAKPTLKTPPSDTDLRNTAMKYGMTVEQVKQKLGLQ